MLHSSRNSRSTAAVRLLSPSASCPVARFLRLYAKHPKMLHEVLDVLEAPGLSSRLLRDLLRRNESFLRPITEAHAHLTGHQAQTQISGASVVKRAFQSLISCVNHVMRLKRKSGIHHDAEQAVSVVADDFLWYVLAELELRLHAVHQRRRGRQPSYRGYDTVTLPEARRKVGRRFVAVTPAYHRKRPFLTGSTSRARIPNKLYFNSTYGHATVTLKFGSHSILFDSNMPNKTCTLALQPKDQGICVASAAVNYCLLSKLLVSSTSGPQFLRHVGVVQAFLAQVPPLALMQDDWETTTFMNRYRMPHESGKASSTMSVRSAFQRSALLPDQAPPPNIWENTVGGWLAWAL